MTFEEAMELFHKAVDAFEETWKKGMDDHPNMFPSEMGDADWAEQFVVFLQDYDPNGD